MTPVAPAPKRAADGPSLRAGDFYEVEDTASGLESVQQGGQCHGAGADAAACRASGSDVMQSLAGAVKDAAAAEGKWTR